MEPEDQAKIVQFLDEVRARAVRTQSAGAAMIVEVFCCSGGFAEGFRRAGLQPDIAFDFDSDACDSYERNLGHRPIQIDARDLLRMSQAGWSLGTIDLLIADPPCTPWSRAGKRKGQADERDMLSVTVELIRLWRPRCWLIANVPGLDDEPNWPIVQREIGGLTREHYCIDFQRIDAASVGVPQHRVRPFWYGHSRGTECIEWPERTHAPVGKCGATLPGITEPRKPYVTCRQALAHLSPEDLGSPVRLRWRQTAKTGKGPRASHADAPAHVVTTTKDSGGDGNVLFDGPNHRPSKADAPARTITRNTHGDGSLLVNERHPVNTLDAPSYTVTEHGGGRGAKGAGCLAYDGYPISRADEPGHAVPSSQPGNGGAVLEWPWDRSATTIQAGVQMAPPGHHEKSFMSDPNAIRLSEKAAAILQGFPEGWVFSGKMKKARWSQLGQAMPPPLAEAVARSMARAMQPRARKVGAI